MAEIADTDKNATGDPLKDLHAEAMRHADEAWLFERQNIADGRDDQRFYIGGDEQWDPQALSMRKRANRPVITINRLPSTVRQLTGDVRQNTPSIRVVPIKDGADEQGAKIRAGLIRHIEQQSNAKSAYVTAADNAAQTGQGGWRIDTVYSSDDGFDQDIRIRRITDPFGLMCDPMAQEPDKSDARYWFVFQDITVEDFRKRWPDAAVDDFPKPGPDSLPWRAGDSIKIGEYWYREPVTKTLSLLEDGSVVEVLKPGQVAKRTREVKAHKIMMCILSGSAVLEKPADWNGRYFPFCLVVGEEIFVDGRVVRKGMIRDAKDPQRVLNYTRTASVEAVALQPKAPFVGTVTQFGVGTPLEDQWAAAGSDNLAFLAYNPDPLAQNAKPERSQPPLAATGLDVQAAIAAEDLKAVTGVYDASLGAKSNETSGRAIMARQREGDTGTYLYIDNLATAIMHCGRILVDLIPRIFDAERVIRILDEDMTTNETVTVNETVLDGEVERVLNDLSAGEYSVAVTTGPSYATRRQEAAESLIEFTRAVPGAAAVISDLVAMNMDWPGADKIAKRLKRTIPPQVLGEEADPDMQPPPPNPAEMADAMESKASADLKNAQAAKTLLEADQLAAQMQAMPQQLAMLTNLVKSLVSGQQPPAPPMPEGGIPPEMMPPEAAPPMADAAPPIAPPGDEGELVDLPPQGVA